MPEPYALKIYSDIHDVKYQPKYQTKLFSTSFNLPVMRENFT